MRLFSLLIAALPLINALANPADTPPSGLLPAGRRSYSTPQCGTIGHDSGHPKPFQVIYKNCDVSRCAQYCKEQHKCKSYAVGKDSCRLYSAPVAGNVKPSYSSPYKFYDRACPCPTPKATGKSTTKKTTTTSRKTTAKTTTTPVRTTRSVLNGKAVSNTLLMQCGQDHGLNNQFYNKVSISSQSLKDVNAAC